MLVWLSAGAVTYLESGTPQAGVVSPLRANIYLHEVLDRWFEQAVKPHLEGKSFLIRRYADDFVMVFASQPDARRVMEVLPKRFGEYGLSLHPEKTRMVDFHKPQPHRQRSSAEAFDLLGFTPYWGPTRNLIGRAHQELTRRWWRKRAALEVESAVVPIYKRGMRSTVKGLRSIPVASALVLLAPATLPAQAPEANAAPAMVAGELIVRLRADFPECAHCLLGRGAGLRSTTGSHILDQVRFKHGITAMEPLFGGVHAAERRQAAQGRFSRAAGRAARTANRSPPTVDLSQIYLVRVHPKTDLLKLAAEFRRDPNVISAEPNYLYSLKSTVRSREFTGGSSGGGVPEFPSPASLAGEGGGEGTAFLPNDPFLHSSGSWGQDFPDLWGLFQIHAPEAWELSQGEGVVVAVVDTGIDIEHPDLAANVWRNEGEIPGNGIDDDGNGYVDDVYGWDFTRCRRAYEDGSCIEAKEPGPDVTDEYGHGTHVAGTIAAVGDNGIGIIGVAPKAQVMAVKGLSERGQGRAQGTNVDLAEALVYAAENGAQVINTSWKGPPSDTIRMAIDYVTKVFDAVVVAGAGNDGVPLERGLYPANLPNVIAVAATTHTDNTAAFSNFGGPLDLVAPGGGDTGAESITSPKRSILSLLSKDARQSDGWAAQCRYKCIQCEDGSPPLEESEPCPPNPCVEEVVVCTAAGCYPVCVRCRDGTVLPPDGLTCPFYDNSCAEYRDICVPGPWVVGEDYVRGSGTSFAAPHVSGVAALVRSRHPQFTQQQVRQVLRNTADDLGPMGWDEHFGYGRVNARRAVDTDDIPIAEILAPQNRGKVWERNFPFSVIGTVMPSANGLDRWRLTVRPLAGGEAAQVASGRGIVVNGVLGTVDLGGRLNLQPGQRYVLDLEAEDTAGHVARDSKTFLIPNPRYAAIPLVDPHNGRVQDASMSANGQRFAFSLIDRDRGFVSLWLFDAVARKLQRFQKARAGRLSPDGDHLLLHFSNGWRLRNLTIRLNSDLPLRPFWPFWIGLANNGSRMAFLTADRFDPGVSNPDGSLEVFLFDIPDGPLRQVTDGPRAWFGAEIQDVAMTPDGRQYAFSAQTDLDPTASTRGRYQIFFYDDATKTVRQLTGRSATEPSGGIRPSISADGARVAYAGDGIFLIDVRSGGIERILDDRGFPAAPLLSADGNKLAFAAAVDLDPQVLNEDLSREIFLLDLTTQQAVQVTDTIGHPFASYDSLMDAVGNTFLVTTYEKLNGLGLQPPNLRVVLRRKPNRAPRLDAPSVIVAQEGKSSRTPLSASDPDADPITFFVQGVPPFESGRLGALARSELHDRLNGTAELLFTPRHNEAGTYALRIAAFDEGGEVTVKDVTLIIEDTQPTGDANCDGQVTSHDIDALIHALFRDALTRCVTADANDDGRLTVSDLSSLLQILSP